MDAFQLISLLLVVAALFSWVNHRFIKLPTTVGVMLVSLGMSLALILLDALGFGLRGPAMRLVEELDFDHALLDIMLAFLLFAGALHIKLDDLFGQKWVISILATVGVLVTTGLVGALLFFASGVLGIDLPFMHCLLFGALIAPTDPIAVLSILKSAGAPKSLETKIAGESLFNDGIGVVVFAVLLQVVAPSGGGHEVSVDASFIAIFFAQEVLGSVLLGFAAGWLTYRMLKTVDNYQVEVLLTLGLCMGLYALATALHSSGPLAVVVAGLHVGNTGRAFAMSETTRRHIDTFWELIDEILNVLLFVLIGMEVLILDFEGGVVALGLLAIPLVLLARFLSVGGTVRLLGRVRRFTPKAIQIMTWGGLRGGISIALALSIPPQVASRGTLLTMTYLVVVFSIVVQGLTMGRLIRSIPGPDRGV
jgi:CPA1 family monovalent cation:H+ antiporter